MDNKSYLMKLSYYRQLYRFYYLIAFYTHPSWLFDIQVSHSAAFTKKDKFIFESNFLLNKIGLEKTTYSEIEETNILLFIASLPPGKFMRLLRHLVLAYLKTDKSLLVDGAKLKTLASFFTKNEMNFLLTNKDIFISFQEPSQNQSVQWFSYEISEDLLYCFSYFILLDTYKTASESLIKRLRLRFPKDLIELEKIDDIGPIYKHLNSDLLKICKYLFPKIIHENNIR